MIVLGLFWHCYGTQKKKNVIKLCVATVLGLFWDGSWNVLSLFFFTTHSNVFFIVLGFFWDSKKQLVVVIVLGLFWVVLGLFCDYSGSVLELLWDCYGIGMGLFWDCHGNQKNTIVRTQNNVSVLGLFWDSENISSIIHNYVF